MQEAEEETLHPMLTLGPAETVIIQMVLVSNLLIGGGFRLLVFRKIKRHITFEKNYLSILFSQNTMMSEKSI